MCVCVCVCVQTCPHQHYFSINIAPVNELGTSRASQWP